MKLVVPSTGSITQVYPDCKPIVCRFFGHDVMVGEIVVRIASTISRFASFVDLRHIIRRTLALDPGTGHLSDVLPNQLSRLQDDLSRYRFNSIEHYSSECFGIISPSYRAQSLAHVLWDDLTGLHVKPKLSTKWETGKKYLRPGMTLHFKAEWSASQP